MRITSLVTLLAVLAITTQAMTAFAGFPPRMIPQGTVELLDSGVVLDKEITAPPGMLMKCRGGCIIEAQGVQLVGSDQTVFGIHEKHGNITVVIQKGSIDFTLHAGAKPLEIITPFKTLHVDPATMTAPPQATLRGRISVDQEEVTLAMEDGSVDVQTADTAETVVAPGKPAVVAQRVESPASARKTPRGNEQPVLLSDDMMAIGAFTLVGAGIATAAVIVGNNDDGSGGSAEISPY